MLNHFFKYTSNESCDYQVHVLHISAGFGRMLPPSGDLQELFEVRKGQQCCHLELDFM